LFQRFDPLTGAYGAVAERDRTWLLERFSEVQKSGVPVISIDYVAPENRALARETARKIQSSGFIPWVADKSLGSLGVGGVEVLPRTILGLYDGSEGPDPVYSNLHRLAVMPLNYLGYQVELHDLSRQLPQHILAGRYAGVIVWTNSDQPDTKNVLLPWVKRQIEQGVPVAFLDRFGFSPALASQLPGVEYRTAKKTPRTIAVLHCDPAITQEKEPQLAATRFVPLKVTNGEALITVGSPDGESSGDFVAVTPWGGYALEPFVMRQGIGGQGDRWILNSFEFFRKALKLKPQPVPDTTTENGVRLLFAHIDADGFESRAEWPGGRIAATELRERILGKYRIPTSFSIITSILGDHGLYPETAPTLQAEARAILALPWVEAASHSFSHPFYWQDSDVARSQHAAQYLPIQGYQFNLDDEISGSIRFIEKTLLPLGKRVSLLQWSGDCTPGSDALSLAKKSGIGTINGGYTAITESNRGMALVGPLGIEKGGFFQVFAPNNNENVYTNHWSGPFYGYRRVLETFRLTDTPRRLKPINVYYHVFSMTKIASWKTLDDVYRTVLDQKPLPIFPSEYVKNVLDFNRTVVAQRGNRWLVRNDGELRQLRIAIADGYPDLSVSSGVMGFSDHNDQRYIHLAPGGEAVVALCKTPPTRPWLVSAAARVTRFEWQPYGFQFSVHAHAAGLIRFGGGGTCRLTVDGKQAELKKEGIEQLFTVPAGSHELELACK
jgi:hypothetical protein